MFMAVELRHLIHPKCLRVSVTPAVFIPSYSNLIRYDCSHIEHVPEPYILCIFDNILRIVELRHYYVYTTFRVPTLFIYV